MRAGGCEVGNEGVRVGSLCSGCREIPRKVVQLAMEEGAG